MENNGKGLFYGVIGVATLVVAIIGATFAYFSATASSDNIVGGNTANIVVSMSVSEVTSAIADFIPMTDADLTKAINGNTDGICKNIQNGVTYGVCKVYKVTINNTGNQSVAFTGGVTLAGDGFTNLKWQQLDTTNETDWTLPGTVYGMANGANGFTTSTNSSLTVAGNTSDDFYFAVWLSNLDQAQSDEMAKAFTGTVTVNGSGGGQLSARFS